ncbi:flagellar hook-basal body protein [Paenibacillus sp. HN-1]|uniref:flagellar hook-basal body protein n=1 Tax=Paenibacillus TaxID=44249 RepID=UPI001CA984B5|nr:MULTISPECIES: flagellar hook-basal body protein [Paenibacillus]MBY9077634.1 flagellar hook-basal body protein [Paenibacillus sp. CGMCC 1.18879]MBY9087441.1 flagellar hook-basal body protein [Paenibacillus sinensis]
MNNSTIGAAVTMATLQQRLDLISDNIANMNTAGYKSKEGSFEDVLTRVQQQSKDYDLEGRSTPLGFDLGFGVRIPQITTSWEQGPLQETGKPTDLAIQGNGLFAVQVDGVTTYTRQGDFHFTPDTANPDRMALVDNTGNPVLDTTGKPLTVQKDASVAIDENGNVLLKKSENDRATLAGRLMLVEPKNENMLQAVDGGRFVLASGVTAGQAFVQRQAGEAGGPAIRAGWLEQSNVDLNKEITDMMQVQRAYQLAARALSSSDAMLGLANSMSKL